MHDHTGTGAATVNTSPWEGRRYGEHPASKGRRVATLIILLRKGVATMDTWPRMGVATVNI